MSENKKRYEVVTLGVHSAQRSRDIQISTVRHLIRNVILTSDGGNFGHLYSSAFCKHLMSYVTVSHFRKRTRELCRTAAMNVNPFQRCGSARASMVGHGGGYFAGFSFLVGE